MKVLWITNLPLPEACELMDERPTPFGGWFIKVSEYLSEQSNINLSIAFPGFKYKEIRQFRGEKINYFNFPNVDMNDKESVQNNKHLKKILEELKPDLVHIFGTEMAHSLAMVNACKNYGICSVLTIQGLVSKIAKHYTVGLPIKVQKGYTFRDLIKMDSILQQQRKFEKRGKLEIEAIKNTNHIIGRTTWDKACSKQINKKARYYICNETLRDEFYKNKWSIEKCNHFSIFISQGAYSIKGLHYVLEALPLILEKYSETKVYIAGEDITLSNTLKKKLKRTYYAKYISRLIEQYNLKNHIIFTGVLDEKQMCDRYLKSHVFVSPSTIENSPNSLGEAMLLGVPSVASAVGGVSDMLKHNEEGFMYQADAPYMMAYYVCKIFGNNDLALKFSNNAREHALKTHDRSMIM